MADTDSGLYQASQLQHKELLLLRQLEHERKKAREASETVDKLLLQLHEVQAALIGVEIGKKAEKEHQVQVAGIPTKIDSEVPTGDKS